MTRPRCRIRFCQVVLAITLILVGLSDSLFSTDNASDMPEDYLEKMRDLPLPDETLNDRGLFVQVEPLDHLVNVRTAMLQPTVRERGEIGIFAEDRTWTYKFLQLHKEAVCTQIDAKRIEHLHLTQFVGGSIALTQRRCP